MFIRFVAVAFFALSLSACMRFGNGAASEDPADRSRKAADDIRLPALAGDAAAVSVSGLSAGAFMATQLQIAYSSTFMGVGSVAGGLWNCANGVAWFALSRCMDTPSDIDVPRLIGELKEAEASGVIDSLTHLQTTRVYLFNSPNDSVVREPMNAKNRDFYSQLVPASQIKTEQSVPSEHGLPTLGFGNACDQLASPFLSSCQFDGAGEILKFIYSSRQLTRGTVDTSAIHRFDQTEFDDGQASLAKEGWIYLPHACENAREHCPVHVALHGCSQGSDAVKDAFVLNAGYNEWAESSHIIIIYPQTYARDFINPKGCFDWFGYTGADYATRNGPQMKAIKKMVDRLTRGETE